MKPLLLANAACGHYYDANMSHPSPVHIEGASPLNPVQFSPDFDNPDLPRALILGGWDQNPILLSHFQVALEDQGMASIGWSAFDSIDPLTEASTDAAAYAYNIELDEALKQVPPRMLVRAARLLDIARIIIQPVTTKDGGTEPAAVIAQCAGANVLLLAHYIADQQKRTELLPPTAVLVEPMLAENRVFRRVILDYSKHEKQAKTDPGFISLNSMRHPEAVNLGNDGQHPARDILDSHGITFLGHAVNNGLSATLLMGEQDVAAPMDMIKEQLKERGVDVPVATFPDQLRMGHGYTFALPDAAAAAALDVLRAA